MSRVFFPLVLVVLVLAFSTQARSVELVDKVVAMVNGQIITLFELNSKVEKLLSKTEGISLSPKDPEYAELQRRILDSMINDILLKQAAAKLKITVSETEISAKINEIKKDNKMTETQFREQLAKEGLTRKEFEQSLETEAIKHQIVGYMVNKRILVTDDELRAYYDQMGGDIPEARETLTRKTPGTIGFLMVASATEAEALRKKIAAGQISFADAARKFSIGPGKDQGGDLGDVSIEDLAPPLRQALQAVPAGEVTKPVSLDGKAVLLVRKTGGDAPPVAAEPVAARGSQSFEQARDRVYDMLYREKFEKLFQEYMATLRAKAVVDVRL
ncbi:peptidylprolyl isomerase [Desulfolutivibrio sulfoxidireducens]|uniref:peptidylprolyl isomerase n=1 Tax=Desulfolutivibrio sulfoxidireducens TaxID=2773299 RepID=UPI00210DFE48|nr:SurA N-terminal domain-containing protein [Desulfolutivibrio sulfoxidireducens]